MTQKKLKPSQLIVEPLGDNFHLVINPRIKNGLRILNSFQLSVLHEFNGDRSLSEIAERVNISIEELTDFISLFSKEQFLVNSDYSPDFLTFSEIRGTINFWVHTTDSCTLNCKYCYIKTKDSHSYITNKIIEVFIDKIIEVVRKYNLKVVVLRLAGGEPLLEFKRWEKYTDVLRALLNKYNCKLNVTFLTNLTILNIDIINFLLKNKYGVGVSLDGLNNFHDEARPNLNGGGSFRIINKNLETLTMVGLRPTIMTVVSNDNLPGLLEFTNFLINKNLKFRYSIVQDEKFNYNDANKVFDEIFQCFENAIEKGYDFENNFQLCDLKFNEFFYQTCGSGLNTGTLYTDGSIYFCQQQVGTTQPLGTVFDKDDLINIIRKGGIYYQSLHPECLECKFQFICTAGCPLIRQNGKSPSCEFFKKYIPIVFKLIGKQRLMKIFQDNIVLKANIQ